MDNLGTLLTKRRKQLDLSQDQVAKAVGVAKSTICRWETGLTPNMKRDKILALAKVLQLDPAEFICCCNNHDETATAADPPPQKIKIPILGTVIAGHPCFVDDNIIGYEEISADYANGNEYFCLKVKGLSMSPRFEEDDILVVKCQQHIESGQIAVVLINGNEATVKMVRLLPEGILLVAYNEDVYKPTFYSSREIEELPVQIIGRVVALKREDL